MNSYASTVDAFVNDLAPYHIKPAWLAGNSYIYLSSSCEIIYAAGFWPNYNCGDPYVSIKKYIEILPVDKKLLVGGATIYSHSGVTEGDSQKIFRLIYSLKDPVVKFYIRNTYPSRSDWELTNYRLVDFHSEADRFIRSSRNEYIIKTNNERRKLYVFWVWSVVSLTVLYLFIAFIIRRRKIISRIYVSAISRVFNKIKKEKINIINRDKFISYSSADELSKWVKLKEDGLVTEEEFNTARKKIMNS